MELYGFLNFLTPMQNMLVQTDALDDIRPDYEATLEICSKDEPFSVSVACIGKPCALNFFL